MNPKYELTNTRNKKGLYRIRALRDFGNVKSGDLGGWVANESNLSHVGDCWIADEAQVFENARVSDNALVTRDAQVFGSALILDEVQVFGPARVYDSVRMYGVSQVSGNSFVYGEISPIYDMEPEDVEDDYPEGCYIDHVNRLFTLLDNDSREVGNHDLGNH